MNKQEIKGALTEYARRTPFNTRDLWPQIAERVTLSNASIKPSTTHDKKATRHFYPSLFRPAIAAGVLTLVLIFALFWMIQSPKTRPLLTGVTDILREAANADKSISGRNLHVASVEQYKYTSMNGTDEGTAQNHSESWIVSPITYREATTLTTPAGKEFISLSVGDSNLLWRYQSQEPSIVLISTPFTRTFDLLDVTQFQRIIDSVGAGTYRVQFSGMDKIVGRDTYVLEGTSLEPGVENSVYRALHQRLWIDSDLFIVLKSEAQNEQGTTLWTYEVTKLETDISIPQSLFAFTPPAGTTVWDTRSQDDSDAVGLWEQAARESGLALSMPPTHIETSEGYPALEYFVGRPYYNSINRIVSVPYMSLPPTGATVSAFIPPSIMIEQGAPEDLVIAGEGYDVQVGEETGRFYPLHDGDVLTVDRDGVRIAIRITSLGSHVLAKNKAIELAQMLIPVNQTTQLK